jgi:hypothetical protein
LHPDNASSREALPFQLERHRFVTDTIFEAPDELGVYFLWEDDELTYVGVAEGHDTIQSRLRDHLTGAVLFPCVATYCSWKLSLDPKALAMEMLADYTDHFQGKPPRGDLATEGDL